MFIFWRCSLVGGVHLLEVLLYYYTFNLSNPTNFLIRTSVGLDRFHYIIKRSFVYRDNVRSR